MSRVVGKLPVQLNRSSELKPCPRALGGLRPTQQQISLNKDLHSCESVEQILMMIERANAKRVALNTVNVITAVNKIAKLKSLRKPQRAEELLQEVLLRSLTTRLVSSQADVGSREIATLTWSLTKLRLTDKHETLWKTLEDIMTTRGFKEFPPMALSKTVWAVAAAGRRPHGLVQRLDADLNTMKLAVFDWRSLSTLVWALATLGHSSDTEEHTGAGHGARASRDVGAEDGDKSRAWSGVQRPQIFRKLEAEMIGESPKYPALKTHHLSLARGGEAHGSFRASSR